MATVVGKTLHDISPETPFVVGWGFRWSEDHWAAGTCSTGTRSTKTSNGWTAAEHHYQGDPTAMMGTYELLTAYGMASTISGYYSYNTETNDLLDLPARGHVSEPETAKKAQHYRRVAYNLRDCLAAVYMTPDKAKSRTVIHVDHTPQAIEGCLWFDGRLTWPPGDDDDIGRKRLGYQFD